MYYVSCEAWRDRAESSIFCVEREFCNSNIWRERLLCTACVEVDVRRVTRADLVRGDSGQEASRPTASSGGSSGAWDHRRVQVVVECSLWVEKTVQLRSSAGAPMEGQLNLGELVIAERMRMWWQSKGERDVTAFALREPVSVGDLGHTEPMELGGIGGELHLSLPSTP